MSPYSMELEKPLRTEGWEGPEVRSTLLQASSYHEFLKLELERIKSVNSRFSLRAFSKKISISPSYFKEILHKKYQISESTILKLVRGLKLNVTEAKYFKALVCVHQSEDPASQKAAQSFVDKIKFFEQLFPNSVSLRSEEWYHIVIKEALRRIRPDLTMEELEKALSLSKAEKDKSETFLLQNKELIRKNIVPTEWVRLKANDRREAQILMAGFYKKISQMLYLNRTEPCTDAWFVYASDEVIRDKIRPYLLEYRKTIVLLVKEHLEKPQQKKQVRISLVGDYCLSDFT